MAKNQIMGILTKVMQSENFKKKVLQLKKEGHAKNITEAEGQKLLKELILTEAKKLGYDISETDLANCCNPQGTTELLPVQKFLAEVLQSDSFKKEILRLKKEGKENNMLEAEGQKLLKEKLLEESKKRGYNLTEKELTEFSNSKILTNFATLSSEDLALLVGDFGIL